MYWRGTHARLPSWLIQACSLLLRFIQSFFLEPDDSGNGGRGLLQSVRDHGQVLQLPCRRRHRHPARQRPRLSRRHYL